MPRVNVARPNVEVTRLKARVNVAKVSAVVIRPLAIAKTLRANAVKANAAATKLIMKATVAVRKPQTRANVVKLSAGEPPRLRLHKHPYNNTSPPLSS
jgi:hypothetical protein